MSRWIQKGPNNGLSVKVSRYHNITVCQLKSPAIITVRPGNGVARNKAALYRWRVRASLAPPPARKPRHVTYGTRAILHPLLITPCTVIWAAQWHDGIHPSPVMRVNKAKCGSNGRIEPARTYRLTRDIEPMSGQCWADVVDGGPTLTRIGSMSRVCWDSATLHQCWANIRRAWPALNHWLG